MVRGPHRYARGTVSKLADPARRAACAKSCRSPPRVRCRRSPSSDRSSRKNQKLARLHAGPCRREDGKHPVDVMLAWRRGGPQDGVLRSPPMAGSIYLKELVDDLMCCSACPTAAPIPIPDAGGYPTEPCARSCASTRCSPWKRLIAAVGAAGRGRGLPVAAAC